MRFDLNQAQEVLGVAVIGIATAQAAFFMNYHLLAAMLVVFTILGVAIVFFKESMEPRR